jgi:hypothetical protein
MVAARNRVGFRVVIGEAQRGAKTVRFANLGPNLRLLLNDEEGKNNMGEKAAKNL